MGDYLLVSQPSGSSGATPASELADLARRAGMAVEALGPTTWLAVIGPNPPKTIAVGPWTLIGDVFNRRRPHLPDKSKDDPLAFERKMLARFWGRFIGVRFGAHDQPDGLLRDPSGALECATWTQDGLTIAASAAPDWLIDRLRPPWTLNIDRIAQAMRDPMAGVGPLLFDGVISVDPGSFQPVPLDDAPVRLWTPAQAAAPSLSSRVSVDDAAAALRDAIDESVSALADLSGPLAAEISGGLDSSLVAASLLQKPEREVALWIHAYGATPEADERLYVGALAERLGISTLSVPHATAPMSDVWLERASQGIRPGLAALDRPHNVDWARRFSELGVKAVMTGKGGDSILLQRATSDVFVDLWRSRGLRSVLGADARNLARTNDLSLWSLVREARRYEKEGSPPFERHSHLLAPTDTPPARHPWLSNCEAFGPAKTLQIAGVADGVARHGPNMLTEVADVRHPLCSQPVIEVCLALPAPQLALGGRDRGLARYAYRDRLPRLILDRRSKGDMTRIYGRMVHRNLDVLRPWLIEGRLAALGLIDPAAAAETLTHERLMWRGRYASVIVAAAFEGWVRVWERRLRPGSLRQAGSGRAS